MKEADQIRKLLEGFEADMRPEREYDAFRDYDPGPDSIEDMAQVILDNSHALDEKDQKRLQKDLQRIMDRYNF